MPIEEEAPPVAIVPKPSIGRIVIYKVSSEDKTGVGHNNAEAVPAVIVRVWSDTCVNLHVLTDGPNTLWKTSVSLGDGPSQWSWPPRV